MSTGYFSRHRQHHYNRPGFGLRFIIRIVGIFTAFVTYALGVTTQLHDHKIAGLLIIVTSFIVLLLELKWLFRWLVLKCCCNSPTSENWLWEFSIKVGQFCGGWRLSFPYVVLGIGFLMWNQKLWLSLVAGIQLLVLSVLRLLTVLRCQSMTPEENLLPQYDFEKIIDGMHETDTEKMPEEYLKASIGPSLENIEPLDEIC